MSEDELRKLLSESVMVTIGSSVRIARWVPRVMHAGDQVYELQLLRPEAFNAKLTGRTYVTNDAVVGERAVPLAKLLMSRMSKRDGLVYLPEADDTVANKINLWRGFGVTPEEGRWPLMEEHIRDILADGDTMQASYILRWLAWAVQHPGERAEVALVLHGGKGVGKGVLGNAMLQIFGTHGVQVSNRKHLTSGFNRHLMHCSFLFADEAFWPGHQSEEGELKRLLTEPTLFIEPKGLDGFSVRNALHVLLASNADWVVPASADERRYAVVNVSSERCGDNGYFAALHRELDAGGRAAMLYDLRHMDLGNWHPREGVPQTAALTEQKAESLRGVDALIADLLQDGCLPYQVRPNIAGTTGAEQGEGLWAYARKTVPSLYHSTAAGMARALRKHWGCTTWHSGSQRGVEFPPLAELRQLFEARFGRQDWAAGEAWVEGVQSAPSARH